jgi:hypothetical protein
VPSLQKNQCLLPPKIDGTAGIDEPCHQPEAEQQKGEDRKGTVAYACTKIIPIPVYGYGYTFRLSDFAQN